jgi:hypothetical protein
MFSDADREAHVCDMVLMSIISFTALSFLITLSVFLDYVEDSNFPRIVAHLVQLCYQHLFDYICRSIDMIHVRIQAYPQLYHHILIIYHHIADITKKIQLYLQPFVNQSCLLSGRSILKRHFQITHSDDGTHLQPLGWLGCFALALPSSLHIATGILYLLYFLTSLAIDYVRGMLDWPTSTANRHFRLPHVVSPDFDELHWSRNESSGMDITCTPS